MRAILIALVCVLSASPAAAQAVTYTGFIEGRGTGYPQEAPNDPTRGIFEGLFRNEIVLRPAPWFQFAAGLDLRANTHDQIEDEWRLDFEDRGLLRPRASVHRLAATLTAGGFTLDLGKQFIRWGRADIIYPTDRFAPRDYLNVVEPEFLPVIGARASFQVGSETFEGIWVPQLTPSRLPLLDQRWAVVPPAAAGLTIADGGGTIPDGGQFGVRWRHTGSRLETALSFFDGFNHHPDLEARPRPGSTTVDIVRVFPEVRMIGGDIAIPTNVVTLKAEAAYVTSPTETSDDYLLFVIEIERQAGEWLLDVGYAGEVIREARTTLFFAPDRRMAKSIIGRASYTFDPRRAVVFEGAVRQSGDGFYGKVEYSQGMSDHWRMVLTGVGIGGDEQDFIGQYHRNSHGSVTLRYSF